nr:drebrin-like [Oryza sativa Japonica Group]
MEELDGYLSSPGVDSQPTEILEYDDFGYCYDYSNLDDFDEGYEDNYTPLFFSVFMADNETAEKRQAREAEEQRTRLEAERRRLEEERQAQERERLQREQEERERATKEAEDHRERALDAGRRARDLIGQQDVEGTAVFRTPQQNAVAAITLLDTLLQEDAPNHVVNILNQTKTMIAASVLRKRPNTRIWFPMKDMAPLNYRVIFVSRRLIQKNMRNPEKCIQEPPALASSLSASTKPTESCPPHHSNSGVEILYALGLLPNSGGLAPPVIGYHTPKTSTLLHDLPRVPIALDAGRKKRAKSAGAPSAAKKKPRKQKATADVLPAIDLDVAEFLEGEELAEDVDEAAEHDSDTREQTPPADPLVPQRTPSPPKKFASKKPQAPAPSEVIT